MTYLKQSIIALAILFVSACTNAQPSPDTLSVDLFEQKIKELDNELLLDVRTPEEFKAGHLEGSVNIDYYNESFSAQLDALDKDKPVMVYCRSGSRSMKAAEVLRQKGFKEVYDMIGGITGWQQKAKKVIR